tara:strand:+ start:39 stop:857 length:819 start_codon:yes stop_codon:yes gene_type:complete
MKVVLLAGGFGSRLAEETTVRPKPMVNIGCKPIIEHIMDWYMHFGYNEFIICLGYKGSEITSYFKDYHINNASITIDYNGKIESLERKSKKWKITLAQTGIDTQTAGRIKKIKKFINKNENFFMTYGDGLSNIDINRLNNFHLKNKKIATLSAVRPLARFGAVDIKEGIVRRFEEKPIDESGWINGGFFVLNEKVINYIKDFNEAWEEGPIKRLVNDNQLSAYKHNGFWQPMDTLREKKLLTQIWNTGSAPWKVDDYKNEIINFTGIKKKCI